MENFPQMEKKTHYLSISGDSTYPRLCRVASREIQSRSQKGLRGNSSLYLHLSENGRETFHNPPQIHLSFFFCSNTLLWLPRWLSGKELICQCRRHGFNPWVGKIPLEKAMAPHTSILAWRIPWAEEPGGLQSTGSQAVRSG